MVFNPKMYGCAFSDGLIITFTDTGFPITSGLVGCASRNPDTLTSCKSATVVEVAIVHFRRADPNGVIEDQID